MADGKLFIAVMGVVPKKALSRFMRRLVRVNSGLAVRWFARKYGLAMHEAERPIDEYPTILDLFTRRLKPGARPVDPDPDALVSPVDATFDASGVLDAGTLLQAKGRTYSLAALLADEGLAEHYEGGQYVTLYLAPKDYHRIHAPVSGAVTGCVHVPGELWPVNRAAVAHVDSLFAVNERLITHIDSEGFGRVALVMVGATNVGHMTAAYDDRVATNTGQTEIERKSYETPVPLEKGGDLGVFEMGSTVVLVVEKGVALDAFALGTPVKMGQRIGARV